MNIMKGKNGNLILSLRENQTLIVDGPAEIKIKKLKTNKVVILVNGANETTIKWEKEKVENGCENKS